MEDLDLTALGAVGIAARVRQGRTSAVRVAQAHLDRIAERDTEPGVFQAHDPRRLLAEAAVVDARPDRFALPLAGVPIAVADDVDVAGYPTRHGSAATSPDPARRDDELVRRLRAAGATIVGKTRMPELAASGDGGGSAPAVAAGMAALALGTDGGGSIRVPAAHCGLVGLKPGRGVLPLPGGQDEHWCGMTETGPLARTAEDAALMFAVLDGRVVPVLSADPPEPEPADWPGGVALSLRSPLPMGRLHDDHRAAAIGAAARLRAAVPGVRVTVADPPYPWRLTGQWSRRRRAGVAREVARLGLAAGELEPRTAAVARRGRRVLRVRAPRDRAPQRWQARFLGWLDDRDLMIGPATAADPLPPGRRRLRAAARTPYAPAWNLAGLPAVVVPVLVDGRPVGVQLVGRPGDERRLLAIAARLEHRSVPTALGAPPRAYA